MYNLEYFHIIKVEKDKNFTKICRTLEMQNQNWIEKRKFDVKEIKRLFYLFGHENEVK